MSRLIKPLSTFFAITLLLTSIVIVVGGGAAGGKFASARSDSVLPSSLASLFSVNHPPLPNPKTVTTNENTPTEITLTGTDPDPGDTITFTIFDRPFHGTISVGSTPNSIRYTPMTGYVGTDAFTYTATDNHGFARTKALVSITVNRGTTNPLPPTAIVGPDQMVNEGTNVTLDGRASTNPQGGPLTYAWTQTAGPPVTLSNPNSAIAKFTAPSVSTNNTLMSFTLTVTTTTPDHLTGSATAHIAVNHVTQPPPVGKDPFGVREIYPTGRTNEEWFMNMNDPNHDPRTEPQTTLTKNSDGTWKIKSDAVRFRAYTSKGYHPELITTTNQKQLAAKGYMQSPTDWRDVEITGYVKLNKVGGSVTGESGNLVGGHYTWYSRNARNTGSGAPEGCLGTAYKGWVNFGGKPLQTRFAKEQWHVSYAYSPYKDTPFTSLFGKWIGFKTIIYSIPLNGKTAVKMESWLDGNNDGNWVKMNEFIDSGGFGNEGGECGGNPDQIITWGGPTAVYRWDNAPDVDVKWFSVREIKSPAALP
jgi:hypothetical protein